MLDPLSRFLDTLNLAPSHDAPESGFLGPSEYTPRGRIFGGQVLAQAVIAASKTAAADRPIHSMHGYFLRPGTIDLPVRYDVERINDGRSFASRRTQASQNGTPIFSMISSFQTEDAGIDHQPEMPRGIPDPEALPTTADIVQGHEDPLPRWWANGRPFDIRHVRPPVYVSPAEAPSTHQALWFKTTGPLPDDRTVHRAALAYVSDYAILDPIFSRHGLTYSDTSLRTASLDHAIWWHRFGRADEWVLYDLVSPAANAARGLTFAHMYSRDGELLASVAQQAMVRVPR